MHTILIVDDEPEIADLLGLFLKKKGFRPIICYGGKKAISTLRKNTHIDLVILDGRMPGVSGEEVAKEIENTRGDLPIVFLTGDTDWKTKHCQIKARRFLVKPIRLDEVEKAINDIL